MKKSDLEFNHKAMETCVTKALQEYQKYKDKVKKHDVLIAVNMAEPSYHKRLFVVRIDNGDVIRRHHVAHGINSSAHNDRAYAVKFSNVVGSRCTSLGAMVTAETYYGKHGLSCKLDGLEPGVNDNVRKRYVVIHSAAYVTDRYIITNGRAGQSDGCLAVDPAISKSLINLVKDGCFVYVYY